MQTARRITARRQAATRSTTLVAAALLLATPLGALADRDSRWERHGDWELDDRWERRIDVHAQTRVYHRGYRDERSWQRQHRRHDWRHDDWRRDRWRHARALPWRDPWFYVPPRLRRTPHLCW